MQFLHSIKPNQLCDQPLSQPCYAILLLSKSLSSSTCIDLFLLLHLQRQREAGQCGPQGQAKASLSQPKGCPSRCGASVPSSSRASKASPRQGSTYDLLKLPSCGWPLPRILNRSCTLSVTHSVGSLALYTSLTPLVFINRSHLLSHSPGCISAWRPVLPACTYSRCLLCYLPTAMWHATCFVCKLHSTHAAAFNQLL